MLCKKQIAVLFFLLLAVAVATPANTTLADSQEPGSVLVFPLFETGTVPAPPDMPYGLITLPRTSFEISVACPNGATCTDGQDVDIHLEWVCPGGGTFPCRERNFILNTTINGTIRFNPTGGQCEPTATFQNLEGCGTVPAPQCPEGYLIAWVVNESGQPIKFDALIGDAVLRENSTAVTAYNAIAIQAVSSLATGAVIPRASNGGLLFNGTTAYQEVTGTIIGSVQYDFVNAAGIDQDQTSLVLLTLDTLSNRPNFPTSVDLDFHNEIEEESSQSTQFTCFEETGPLFFAFGLSTSTFGPKGLVQSIRAEKTAVGGISDTAGPVTLLGLVITREIDPATGTLLRHFAYPLSNDSVPVATTFVP